MADMTEKNKVEPSTLYLVATPIGNLDDITVRAVKMLRECDFIAAEDTRVTGKLLAACGIEGKSILTYEEHSKKAQGQIILKRLKEGQSCALVTDAGTPGISDPGEDMVKLCIENGIRVVPIPGACAGICALTVSGFSTGKFVFEGFLSGKPQEKKERLGQLVSEKRTVIFYEAPHRLQETLSLMTEVYGIDRKAAFCRELTKLNEEILRMTFGDAEKYFSENAPRGEFVIAVEGQKNDTDMFWSDMTVTQHVEYYTEKIGLEKMAAIKAVARDRGVPKNAVYKELID